MNEVVAAPCPVVTVTVTAPAACAGTVTVTELVLGEPTIVAAVVPNLTELVLERLVPLIVAE